ncbi:MAG: hypothetical protein ACYTGZ_15235 [Planctomycetota bacterium]
MSPRANRDRSFAYLMYSGWPSACTATARVRASLSLRATSHRNLAAFFVLSCPIVERVPLVTANGYFWPDAERRRFLYSALSLPSDFFGGRPHSTRSDSVLAVQGVGRGDGGSAGSKRTRLPSGRSTMTRKPSAQGSPGAKRS